MPAPVSTVIRSASATQLGLGRARPASTDVHRLQSRRGAVPLPRSSRHPGRDRLSLRSRPVPLPGGPMSVAPSRPRRRPCDRPLPPLVRSRRGHDPVVDRRGHDPRSALRRAVLARRPRPDRHVAAAPPRRRLRPPPGRLRARRRRDRPAALGLRHPRARRVAVRQGAAALRDVRRGAAAQPRPGWCAAGSRSVPQRHLDRPARRRCSRRTRSGPTTTIYLELAALAAHALAAAMLAAGDDRGCSNRSSSRSASPPPAAAARCDAGSPRRRDDRRAGVDLSGAA